MIAKRADHQGADKNSMTRLQIALLSLNQVSGNFASNLTAQQASINPKQAMIEGLARHQKHVLTPDKPEENFVMTAYQRTTKLCTLRSEGATPLQTLIKP
jgi:hypothetical protein